MQKKTFFINIPEIGEVNVTRAMLTLFRTRLKDQNYNISKIYGFKAKKEIKILLKEEHFTLPDFKFHVKIKYKNSNDLV